MLRHWTIKKLNKANKWNKSTTKECMSFFINSWEEMNDQIHYQEKCCQTLKQRTSECFQNKQKCDDETQAHIEDIKEKENELNKEQLKLKIETLIR